MDRHPSQFQPGHSAADRHPGQFQPGHSAADRHPSQFQPSHSAAHRDLSHFQPGDSSADRHPSQYQPIHSGADRHLSHFQPGRSAADRHPTEFRPDHSRAKASAIPTESFLQPGCSKAGHAPTRAIGSVSAYAEPSQPGDVRLSSDDQQPQPGTISGFGSCHALLPAETIRTGNIPFQDATAVHPSEVPQSREQHTRSGEVLSARNGRPTQD